MLLGMLAATAKPLSTAGWIFLCLIVFLFVTINLWLLSAWLHRNRPEAKTEKDIFNKMSASLKDPWSRENKKWQELNEKVSSLPKKKAGEDEHV